MISAVMFFKFRFLLVGMFGLGSFELGPLEYEVGVITHWTAALMN
jgi:hypothetical protein